ncbi:hypothetical protein N7451_003431 [Penicillium sp. IBT 35674x]|nr:hypothetical protein N7451_003431 [Penicillium sp. IBT 35674x]
MAGSGEKTPSVDNIEDIALKMPAKETSAAISEDEPPSGDYDRSCYCIALMDRTNLSMADIAGMEKELALDIGNRYSINIMLFFVAYIIFQPVMIGCFAGALAGLLAFGLMQANGAGGLAGWRWIFILEGVITGVIGILCFIFLVDFPDRAATSWRFLDAQESAFIVRRINNDRHDSELEAFSLKKFLRPALDPKIWAFGLIFLCLTTVTLAIFYFLPIILIDGMGFSVGDKYHTRGLILVGNALLCIIGLPVMGFAKGNATRYAGVFLTVAGSNANVPALLAYQANNVRG